MVNDLAARNIELRHLRYFLVAAEEEHIRRAALRLNIAQPALSRQIKDLEERIGVTLFERVNHRVRLTEAGRALADDARRLLRQAEMAVERAVGVSAGRIGHLRVGFSASTVRHAVVPDVLMAFRKGFPEVELAVVQMNSAKQLDALRAGEIDAAFGFHEPEGLPEFGSHRMGRDGVALILPLDNPLAGRATLRLADLAEEEFIWMRHEHNTVWHRKVTQACRDGGLLPRVVQEVQLEDEQTLLTFVARGMGLCFMYASVRQWGRQDLHMRDVVDLKAVFDLQLAWANANRSPALASFLTLAKGMSTPV